MLGAVALAGVSWLLAKFCALRARSLVGSSAGALPDVLAGGVVLCVAGLVAGVVVGVAVLLLLGAVERLFSSGYQSKLALLPLVLVVALLNTGMSSGTHTPFAFW